MSRATIRKPRANRHSNSTPNEPVSAQQPTTITEVSQLSSAALLTMAWFQVTGAGDGENERDVAFRQVLINELVERGVLNKPELAYDSINGASLTEDNLDSFATMFQEPGEPTLEDSFVKAVTGIDRFKERSQPKCPECQDTVADDLCFNYSGQTYHPRCFAIGESFDELEERTRWLLRLVTEVFRTFRTEYDAKAIPELAAGFMPDLDKDLEPLLAEVRQIREQAAKLTPAETAKEGLDAQDKESR